jgi:hypothetical protein
MGAKAFWCACPDCVRRAPGVILTAWGGRPKWLGEYAIRYYAGLAKMPLAFYREQLARMMSEGILIAINDPEAEYPVYLPTHIATRAMAGKAVAK